MSGAISWWVSRKGGDPKDVEKYLYIVLVILIVAVIAKLLGTDVK